MSGQMKITIHRGANTIGGSCVELRCGGSRIILDLGMPLMKGDGTEFDMRPFNKLKGRQLLEAGLLPPVEGLYAWQTPQVDAVLISHAHQDHYGLINHVHPGIPVFLGEGTRRLIEISTIFTPNKTKAREWKNFSWREPFMVGGFRVTPHLVDHSSFGAFAFEIEAEGKRVFYSGDFRNHGYLGKTLDILRDRCRPGCDVLLMEGTMFGREDEPVLTEQELADKAAVLCRETPGAVLVYQSGQNASRAVSFYKAARASGRFFVPDYYTAHVLAELGKCAGGGSLPYPGNLPDIRVWYPRRLTNKAEKEGFFGIPSRYAKHKITKREMAAHPERVMLFVRPGMESDLECISELSGGMDGATLIYSLWGGYRKKGNTNGFLDACARLGIADCSLHTSGHATREAMRSLLDTVQPKVLIPIHTRHPEQYETLGYPVRRLQDGEEYAFS